MRADLVLPRWLVHRWADDSARIEVGASLRAELFVPRAPDRQRGRRAARRVDRYRAATMSVEPPRLFVYGTLQPGRLRWPFLAAYAVGHRPAEVPGLLFDSGYGWPVATFVAAAAGAVVPGTLVDLRPDRLGEALVVLDEVEATATDLLVRIAVTTTDGAAAWAYDCRRPEPHMRRIERWTSTDER